MQIGFNKILEEYIFRTASTVIDSADKEEQASLIKLLDRIDTSRASSECADNLSGWLINQLEEQWRQALNEPLGDATHS